MIQAHMVHTLLASQQEPEEGKRPQMDPDTWEWLQEHGSSISWHAVMEIFRILLKAPNGLLRIRKPKGSTYLPHLSESSSWRSTSTMMAHLHGASRWMLLQHLESSRSSQLAMNSAERPLRGATR